MVSVENKYLINDGKNNILERSSDFLLINIMDKSTYSAAISKSLLV